ncbi:ATP-binding protein [Actinomadura violacea]|uniref:ATP-binding protein n=1 Tax=Actinomadura violacea TaxID=2819934 RepID=A0ABS3RIP9_9ACTN|nr:ATP-binding protein [Actinomadura violacea]MBO2456615.1 ATP-binding protein [Actinomadura violacea]
MAEASTLVIEAELQEVKRARDFVALAFGAWGLEDHVARTVVSELAANAIEHGSSRGDPVVVRAYQREDGSPVVEVWDRSDTLPVVGPVDLRAEGGRGLRLMEALVRAWGVRHLSEGGKVVWAAIEPVSL